MSKRLANFEVLAQGSIGHLVQKNGGIMKLKLKRGDLVCVLEHYYRHDRSLYLKPEFGIVWLTSKKGQVYIEFSDCIRNYHESQIAKITSLL